FSRGLSNTFEIINALGWRLLDALRDDDFDVERFRYVERLEQGLLDFNDDLVANAYTSFQDFSLWDAWFRMWSLGQILATFEINRAYARYLNSHDAVELHHLEQIAPAGSITEYAPARRLMAVGGEHMRDVAEGRERPGDAARAILRLLDEADFIP